METIYLGIVIFLFVLAIFDLVVGVSNDAVNSLQSAVGAKAASFKTILFIAGIGVFIGAALSNGLMTLHDTASINWTLLLCRNHVHSACRHVDGRRAIRCLQHYGNAYLHHCIHGVQAAWGVHSPLQLIKVYNSDTHWDWATSSIQTRHCLSSRPFCIHRHCLLLRYAGYSGWHVSCSPSTHKEKNIRCSIAVR